MNSAHGYTEGAEVPQQAQADKANEGREFKEGDIVCFVLDLRGFIAHYEIICIKNDRALIQKTHLWFTDPYNETWQPLSKLRHYG